MKTAIDWENKPEPLRSMGLAFSAELRRICGRPKPLKPKEFPDQNGIILFSRRMRLKISQRELAQRCGLASRTISALECGNTTVSAETWNRIESTLSAAEVKRR